MLFLMQATQGGFEKETPMIATRIATAAALLTVSIAGGLGGA